MTTLNEAREAIYGVFDTDWSVGPVSAYCFENEKFETPNNAPWVRLSVRNQVGRQQTLGQPTNRIFQRYGAVFVQIFVPVSTAGTKTADTLAARARALFEGTRIAGTTVNFQDCHIRESGIDDGKWYQVVVEAEFEYTETK
jgi:hypothetical protein